MFIMSGLEDKEKNRIKNYFIMKMESTCYGMNLHWNGWMAGTYFFAYPVTGKEQLESYPQIPEHTAPNSKFSWLQF